MHRWHTGLWNVQLHHGVTGFARSDTRKFKAKKLRRLLNKSIELKLPIFKHTPVRGETVPLEHKHSDILLALSVIAHNTALKLASLISHRLLKHKLGLSFCYRSHAQESVRLGYQTIAEKQIWPYDDRVKISADFHVEVVTSETTQRSIWVDPIVWHMWQELGPKSVVNPAVAILMEDGRREINWNLKAEWEYELARREDRSAIESPEILVQLPERPFLTVELIFKIGLKLISLQPR